MVFFFFFLFFLCLQSRNIINSISLQHRFIFTNIFLLILISEPCGQSLVDAYVSFMGLESDNVCLRQYI